jgi:hypothetical protein
MYRGGLTRGQIAKLVGAPVSTVGYHLTAARAGDPELRSAHEAADALQTTHRATRQGMERVREIVVFMKEMGRYPSRASSSESERTLATWLQRRREEARDGTLAPVYRDGVAALSEWQTPTRAEATARGGRRSSLPWLTTAPSATGVCGHASVPSASQAKPGPIVGPWPRPIRRGGPWPAGTPWSFPKTGLLHRAPPPSRRLALSPKPSSAAGPTPASPRTR